MKPLVIIGILILLLVVPAAAENDNYTQVFSPLSDDYVHVNTSYTMAKTTTTPYPVWLFMVILSFVFLSISVIIKPESGNDFFAYIAVMLFAFSIYMTFGIDVVTSYGVTSQPEVIAGPDAHEYILLENHTIYHPEAFIFFLVIFFFISLFNAWKVWGQHKELRQGTTPAEA